MYPYTLTIRRGCRCLLSAALSCFVNWSYLCNIWICGNKAGCYWHTVSAAVMAVLPESWLCSVVHNSTSDLNFGSPTGLQAYRFIMQDWYFGQDPTNTLGIKPFSGDRVIIHTTKRKPSEKWFSCILFWELFWREYISLPTHREDIEIPSQSRTRVFLSRFQSASNLSSV